MPRQTKERLCEQLTAAGIQFDPEAKFNDLYKLLPEKPAEKLTTQSMYAPPPVTEQKKIKVFPVMDGQCCGRCKCYRIDRKHGVLSCRKRGGRRAETAGGDCEKFEAKNG